MARGALLLAIAVVLGVVLLNTFDDGKDPFAEGLVATDTTTSTTTTIAAPATTTTSTAAKPTLHASGDVKVLPANGTNTNRFGARVGDKLKASGFNVLSAVDSTPKGVAASVVYSTPGYEADAADIASKLGLAAAAVKTGAPTVSSSDLRGANVIVVAGTDLISKIS
jgi:hypothetical protein